MFTPKFTISNKILRNIGAIEASKEIIDHAPLLPYYEREFRKDAILRTVHYGTHIEGNELDLTQAQKILEGGEVVARERDIQEVINYRRVMEFVGSLESKAAIDEDLVLRLHKLTVDKILEEEKSGVWRKNNVVIKNSKTGEVSFRPPDAIKVAYLISDFLAFLNSQDSFDIHPVLKSGIVHYEMVRVHPFVDGNGRVARALSTLVLLSEGYDIRHFFSLEEYYDNDAAMYYEALQSVVKKDGDLTTWLEYFTLGLSIELSKIKDKIEQISRDIQFRKKLGGKPILLTDRQLKIIEYVQKTGFLQNKAFPLLFPMVSEDTILNELRGLLKSGILKKRGVTKGAKYIMS